MPADGRRRPALNLGNSQDPACGVSWGSQMQTRGFAASACILLASPKLPFEQAIASPPDSSASWYSPFSLVADSGPGTAVMGLQCSTTGHKYYQSVFRVLLIGLHPMCQTHFFRLQPPRNQLQSAAQYEKVHTNKLQYIILQSAIARYLTLFNSFYLPLCLLGP